jgi:hypothetical protein
MVEFGSVRNKPIVLTETEVLVLAEALRRMCESLCNNESTSFKDGDLRLTTTGYIKVARLYLGKQYMTLKLEELHYIEDMFCIIHNQQILYFLALPDVLSCVTAAQSSPKYIEPHINASNDVLYPQLFEELKSILMH